MLGLARLIFRLGNRLAEKLAALFPGLTDAVIALGNSLVMGWTGRRRDSLHPQA